MAGLRDRRGVESTQQAVYTSLALEIPCVGGLPHGISWMKTYKLADWAIDPETNRLIRGDSSARLESRVMQMLVYFCEHPNRVISRAELMEAVWGTQALSANSVSVAIRSIRQALRDDAHDPRYIETHQKLGYRLLIKPQIVGSTSSSKRRTRRRVVTGAVLGLLAAIAVTLSVLRDRAETGFQYTVITLDRIDNATGLEQYDDLAIILGDLVIAELAQAEAITVRKAIPGALTDALTVDLETAENVTSITGRLLGGDGELNISLYLEDTRSAEILWAHNQSLDEDRILSDTKLISRDLITSLGIEAGGDIQPLAGRDQARQAIELDPEYGPAHGLLAELYSWHYPAGFWGMEGDMFVHAEHELELARRHGAEEAYILVTEAGIHLSRDRRYDLSMKLLKRAAELRPDDPWVLRPQIWTYMLFGDFDTALDHNLRAAEVSLDPNSVLAERVVPLYYSGRFQEAHDLYRATLELGLKPVFQGPQAAMMRGDQVGGFGGWVEFIRRQGVEIEDESQAAQWASGGDLRSAYDWLRDRVGHYGRNWSFALNSAGWHWVAGDRELAVAEAVGAIRKYRREQQPTGMPGYEWALFRHDPLFCELRKDPRVIEVLGLLDIDGVAE
jgi:DNA-binding winged helix-turn-helix (wHTH) protein/tetratricopeptide (TPR) repeat protein